MKAWFVAAFVGNFAYDLMKLPEEGCEVEDKMVSDKSKERVFPFFEQLIDISEAANVIWISFVGNTSTSCIHRLLNLNMLQ